MTQWGLDTLFNPAKRHMDEEKRRLQATREELGDSSGGKRIDLESGKVTIRRRAGEKDAADDTDDTAEAAGSADDAGDRAEQDGKAGSDATGIDATGTDATGTDATGSDALPARELTPAQLRAARRRGRDPR
jgi:hypothetical protein